MCCGCGSEDVTFCICENESEGYSDFDKDLIARYNYPFGASKGNAIDPNALREYILDTYRNKLERFFLTTFAAGTCFGDCEDETECAITFEGERILSLIMTTISFTLSMII